MTAVQQAARDAYAAGISIVPPMEDGSKRPAASWKQYTAVRADTDTLRAWWGGATGVGVVCGAVSGGLEVFEFDDRATYDAYCELAHQAELGDLIRLLESGYVEDTPSGGVHWLYRCETVGGNTKLAGRPSGASVKTLIETRGEGGYCILAPSRGRVHPTGKPYLLRAGGFATIPTLTPEQRHDLHQLAQSFDETPAMPARSIAPSTSSPHGERPGDAYAARTSWADVLEPAGWCRVYGRGDVDYWRRPGKTHGISASTNYAGSGFLIVHSTSTPFETKRGYNKFSAFAKLYHQDDYGHAAKALADRGFAPLVLVASSEVRTRPAVPLPEVADFVCEDGRYVLYTSEGITFELDRVRRKWDELVGELLVRCEIAGALTVNHGILSAADFNLSSLKSRQDRARHLAERALTPTLDWYGLVEEFSQRVLTAERAGQPSVHLRDLERPLPDEDCDIEGVRVLRRHPIILFGDGGTAKSMLALYVAGRLTHHGLRVLYADWEFAGEDHRARLEDLFGQPMPDVQYVRCERSLVHEADRLRRIVRDEAIDYTVVDSIAFACDGPPEAAESAAAFYRALRTLNTGSFLIAHTNRSEAGDQKPFGSTFWHNGARATWFIQRERLDVAADGQTLVVGLFNRKANCGPLRPAVGFELAFGDTGTGQQTSVRRVDLTRVAELAAKLPLWQRIVGVLHNGPQTLATIADELGAKVDSVEKAVNRSQGRTFVRVDGTDRVTRIALVDRRSA